MSNGCSRRWAGAPACATPASISPPMPKRRARREALRRALVTSEDADEALRLLALAFAPRPQQEAA